MNKYLILARTYDLTPPTWVHYCWGMVMGNINRLFRFKNKEVQHFFGYTLEKVVSKTNGYHNYRVGIYTKNGVRYFVKFWSGTVRDYNFYSLVNEFFTSAALYSVSQDRTDRKIYFPDIKDLYVSRNSMAIIYEYIDGHELTLESKEVQQETITNVLAYLKSLAPVLSSEYKPYLKMRGFVYYCVSFPYYFYKFAIPAPSKVLSLIPTLIRSLLSLRTKSLIPTHGDLTTDNIRVSGERIYLVDFEYFSLTYSGYDRYYFYKQVKGGMPGRLNEIIRLSADVHMR